LSTGKLYKLKKSNIKRPKSNRREAANLNKI